MHTAKYPLIDISQIAFAEAWDMFRLRTAKQKIFV